MVKNLLPESPYFFQFFNKGSDFAPIGFGERRPSSLQSRASLIPLKVSYFDYFLPHAKLAGLFGSQRILFKERNDNMIKIGNGANAIYYLWILIWSHISPHPDFPNTQNYPYLFQNSPVILPQIDKVSRMKKSFSIIGTSLTKINICQEASFPICESGQPVPKIIGDFQVEAKSSLHRNLLKEKPTSPLLVLLCERADDKRTDGHISELKYRPLSHRV